MEGTPEGPAVVWRGKEGGKLDNKGATWLWLLQ